MDSRIMVVLITAFIAVSVTITAWVYMYNYRIVESAYVKQCLLR